MYRYFELKIIIIILFTCSSINAQDQIDDRGVGENNHNYFAVRQSSYLQNLLKNVESNHIDRVHDNPNGVYGYIRDGRLDDAIADLDFALRKFVNHPRALILLGLVAKLKKKSALPIPYYKKALKLYPRYALTHAQYGMYLAEIGYIQHGINRLKKAIKIDPNLKIAYVFIAKAYYKNGNLKLAQQAADKAKALGYRGEIFEKKIKK